MRRRPILLFENHNECEAIIMAQYEWDRNQVETWVDRIVRRTMRMDMPWDWPSGVAYYGI